MARNTRTATIKVDADVRKAIKGMKDVSDSVSDAEKHMARWSAESEKAMQAFDRAGQASAGATKGVVDSLKDANASVMNFVRGFGAVTGAAGLAAAAIGKAAQRASELAHESLRTQAVFGNLKFAIDGAATASLGLVDNMTLAQAQVKALELGAVDNAQQFEDLVEAGAKLGLVMSGDAAQGVEDLTTALARGSGPILDNLGITLNQSKAQEIYAEQLGKSVGALTAAEKAEAFRVIGLQKAVAAAREKNIEDSLSLTIAQKEVLLANERAAILGAEVDQRTRLKTALASLGDDVAHLNVQNRTHGADLRKVEVALAKYGLTIEDVGGKAKLQAEIQKAANKVIMDQARAAEAAARAEAERAAAMEQAARMAEVNADLANLQHAVNLQVAEFGAGSEEAAAQAFALAGAQLEVARTAAMAADATDKEAQALDSAQKAFEVADARLRGASRRGGGRGRGGPRRDPLADLFKSRGDDQATEKLLAEMEAEDRSRQEQAEALAAEHFARKVARMEREIELKRELGQETEFLERRLAQVQLERATAEADGELQEQIVHAERLRRIEQQNEARERYHQAELERLEQERAEREALERTIEQGVRTTVQGLAQSTEAAMAATSNKGAAFAAEVSEFASSRAKILAIDAATHFALAAAYALALNPVKAAAELAAGAKSSAAAAAMGALAAATGAAAGGGSPGGVGGSAFNQGPPNTGTRPGQANSAPVSPLEQNGQPAPQSGQAGGQVINLHVAGSFIDSGGQLQELIGDASANGGRSLRGGLG